MAECKVAIAVPGADPAAVWRMLEHPERWPGVVDRVRSIVRIQQPVDEIAKTEWEVEVGQAGLWWSGEEHYHPEKGLVSFHSTEGDLESLEGYWQVSTTEDGACLELAITFDVGIPSLRSRVEGVAQRMVIGTAEDIVNSVLTESMAGLDAGKLT